jgi:hypothetical protein
MGSAACAASRRWQHRTRAVVGVRDSAVRVELLTGIEGASSRPVRKIVLRA